MVSQCRAHSVDVRFVTRASAAAVGQRAKRVTVWVRGSRDGEERVGELATFEITRDLTRGVERNGEHTVRNGLRGFGGELFLD